MESFRQWNEYCNHNLLAAVGTAIVLIVFVAAVIAGPVVVAANNWHIWLWQRVWYWHVGGEWE